DSALHPRFLPKSDSLHIRNGVGTSADGSKVWFAISQEPVNFHSFARLFRDHLKTPNALFLDGSISKLFAPDLNRRDLGFPMGPIIGVVDARSN
ncbi:MAG: phosphodiester glycosidase family protein, partial [Pseudomonadota bacterium]